MEKPFVFVTDATGRRHAINLLAIYRVSTVINDTAAIAIMLTGREGKERAVLLNGDERKRFLGILAKHECAGGIWEA